MSEHQSIVPGRIVLRAAVEIDGRGFETITTADPVLWADFPQYQDAMKAETLRLLAEAIVNDLAPEVTVTMPAPSLHASLTEALRPFDYPNEY